MAASGHIAPVRRRRLFKVTVSEAILEPDKFRAIEPKPATIRKYLQELKRPTSATNVSWKVSLLLELALEWPEMGQAVAQAMHQEPKAKTLAEQRLRQRQRRLGRKAYSTKFPDVLVVY